MSLYKKNDTQKIIRQGDKVTLFEFIFFSHKKKQKKKRTDFPKPVRPSEDKKMIKV